MRRYRFVTAVLAALVLLGGLLLIPRRDEHLTMLARDGRFEEASRIIEDMRAQGDARPELSMHQVHLYMKQGDVARALAASRSYLEAKPDDAGALEIHVELLLFMGLTREHLAQSGRLVRLRPEPERIARLLAHLRLAGDVDGEIALLSHFAGSPVLRLEHYGRLGALLSMRGDWQGAARWLRHVDRNAPPEETQSRLRLLHVLLQSGRKAEAGQLAQRWLASWRNAYLAGRLILTLAQQGGVDAALPLVARLIDTMPATVLEIAGVLTEAGQAIVSREMLSRWIDRTPSPTAVQGRDYVHASFAAGERRKPLQKLLLLMRAGAAPDVVAPFVEQIAHAYGPDTLAHLMPQLSTEILRQRPVLAADLALASGNLELARWYLEKVDIKDLSEQQQDRWLELLARTGSATGVLERLLILWKQQHLPPRLIATLAEHARAAGRPGVHDAIWASLRH